MVERRRFERYPLYCPVEYKNENDPGREGSMTKNISEGGAFITTNAPVNVGDNMIVKMVVKNEDFYIRTVVIHVKYDEERSLYCAGIEFVQIPPRFIRKFYDELETIMLFQKKYGEDMGREVALPEASMQWYKEIYGWPRGYPQDNAPQ